MTGENLGHYRIEEQLGEGGMGVVYRATDTKLGRHVAIKVLPDTVAGDEERLRRFESEARVLASLNHPNIAVIHGFESDGDTHFLVMELVEGQTLAQRLASGPLELGPLLKIFGQVAEALEAAHEKGVAHRDLKPQNLMITPEGRVKVLDFGLAKALGPVTTTGTQAMTVTVESTKAHQVMGTGPYMSPEQVRGETIGKGSDIWSYGCVLYEALTGHRAFGGGSLFETAAAVLKEEPDWDAVPPDIPPTIVKLLRRCLKKELSERLKDIGDARIEIHDVLAEHNSGAFRVARPAAAQAPPVAPVVPPVLPVAATPVPGPAEPETGMSNPAKAGVAVAILAVVIAAGWWLQQRSPSAPAKSETPAVAEDLGPPVHNDEVFGIAFSPDGKMVASGSGDGTVKVWDTSTGNLVQNYSAKASRVFSVVYSPNGSWLAAGTEANGVMLWQPATKAGRALEGHRGAVSAAVFSPTGALMATGGQDTTVKVWDTASWTEKATLSGHSDWIRGLAFSPDSRMLASAGDDRTVKVWDLSTNQQLKSFSHPKGVPSVIFGPKGQWVAAGTWQAVNIWDLQDGKKPRVLQGHETWVTAIALSPDGKVLASGGADMLVKLWDPEAGKSFATLSGHGRGVSSAAFSPDGKVLATASWDKTAKLWNANTGAEIRTLGKAAAPK